MNDREGALPPLLEAYLRISQVPDLGPVTFDKLTAVTDGKPETILDMSPEHQMALGLNRAQVSALSQAQARLLNAIATWLSQSNLNRAITRECAEYPRLLRETKGAPIVLFCRGNLSALHAPQIAVVGSRRPSHTGAQMARSFGQQLGEAGWTVTSGLALGVDALSHRGALDVSANTVAILGTGIDFIYPRRHIALADDIVASGGVIVSEYIPGTPPKAHNFPARNRIISGVSMGTLVIEAAVKSGSLITAKLAAEQGRDVFAIPGSIYNPASAGCHHLIQQGAKLVTRVDDINEEFQYLNLSAQNSPEFNLQKSAIESLADCKLLDSVGFEATALDVVLERSAVPINDALSMLTEYELRGLVAAIPGGYIKLGGK